MRDRRASRDREPGYEIEEFVELEEGDGRAGGGAAVERAVTAEHGLAVQ